MELITSLGTLVLLVILSVIAFVFFAMRNMNDNKPELRAKIAWLIYCGVVLGGWYRFYVFIFT